MTAVVVLPLRRLRRGDRILKVGWVGWSQRMLGASKASPVLGTFVMRKPTATPGDVALVYRRAADGEVIGYESSFPAEAAVAVLR